MDFVYRFPVVKGVQAKREYYIAMIPLKMIPKLFPPDGEYVLPEYRAQRKLNESRIPVISKYILNNRENYVFSALAASIDGAFRFCPSDHLDVGVLEISMDAKLLINDGQHRKAAILEAIKEDETLLNETISVVFFEDQGLARSQQMFTDLNKHAVKTSNSIAELYDSRDLLAVVTRNVVSKIRFLNAFTDKEKDILGKYSSNLFTLSTFYNANKRIIRPTVITPDAEDFLYKYWSSVSQNILPWQDLSNREIRKVDLRQNYIVTQAVIIQVLGRLGNFFFTNPDYSFDKHLRKLKDINWRRDCEDWALRTIRTNGRMINNEEAITLTCNMLELRLDLPLDELGQSKERAFIDRK